MTTEDKPVDFEAMASDFYARATKVKNRYTDLEVKQYIASELESMWIKARQYQVYVEEQSKAIDVMTAYAMPSGTTLYSDSPISKRIEEEKALGLSHHDGPMRSKLLRTADNLTCGDRNAAYGDPYDNMVKTANLWSDYLDFRIKPHEAATMMELLKIARTKGGPFKPDNYIDGSAYSSIAGECHWIEEQRGDE